MDNDTYLVLMIVNPYDSQNVWQSIRLLAVDLMDHDQIGPKDDAPMLSLRGGTPGVPSFAPATGLPLVYDGRFASPGDLRRVAASGPEWILSATDIGQLANRISARYQSDVRADQRQHRPDQRSDGAALAAAAILRHGPGRFAGHQCSLQVPRPDRASAGRRPKRIQQRGPE
jgi:hypothetical protein